MKIRVVENIYDYNKEHAEENRKIFKDNKIMTINILSSPGAGKTSLITETIKKLKNKRIGVIEGDISSTLDAEKLKEYTEEIVQINTGGTCHLNASMVYNALKEMNLENIDILFIENVGNLICPVSFDLGEDYKILLSSVSEGDDKPVKYPKGFAVASLVILNKIDLYDYFVFNREFFLNNVKKLNPSTEIIELSCKSSEGIDSWLDWICKKDISIS
ncbi:MAG: hydrogenase nickel incorporation protein HypB [Actinomycetota bacterium]|nr:hydrogenase nickel incorporation protein HypB [Actinomycetota bacterium]